MSFDKQGNITNDLFESSLRQNQLFRIYPNLPRFHSLQCRNQNLKG